MGGGPVEGLKKTIRGHVFTPRDSVYDTVAPVFNTRFDHVRPQAVARPVDGPDVRDAVRFTAARGVRVFRTHPVPAHSTYFNVRWPWPSADAAIDAWQHWAPHTTDKITSILHLNAHAPASINANGQYLGPAGDIPRLLAPLLSVSGATLSSTLEAPFLSIQLLLANCRRKSVAACHTVNAAPGGTLARESFNAKSDYVAQPLDNAGRAAMIAAVEAPGVGSLLCDAYGGAVARIDPTATAFAHRHPLFCIQYFGVGASAAWIHQAWTKLRPHVSGQAYQNYIDPALPDWQDAYYYAHNRKRLQAIRAFVDPHHYFNFPQAIGR